MNTKRHPKSNGSIPEMPKIQPRAPHFPEAQFDIPLKSSLSPPIAYLEKLKNFWRELKQALETQSSEKSLPPVGGLRPNQLNKVFTNIDKSLLSVADSIQEKIAPYTTIELVRKIKRACKTIKNPTKSLESSLSIFQQKVDLLTLDRLLFNSRKAINEHKAKETDKDVFAPVEMAVPTLEQISEIKSKGPALNFTVTMASEDNPRYREHNEDAHFAHKIDEGLIAGVFDGHSGNGSDGKIVSNFAAKYFSYHFPLYYKKYHLKGILSVKEVFEKIISEMDEELSKDMISFRAGCTAVCCFIEQESHLIYTATLGDSEANLYRKFGDEILSIPLSIVRDWSSQKDANRAALALKDPSVAEEWPKETLSKELRFKGLNVARAIGDRQCSGHGIRAVVPTPKITVNVVYPGDRLLVTCDGVKDFTREEDLTRLIQKIDNGTAKYPHLTLAQQVVNLAINHASSDNVTVVAVNFIGKEENG